MAKRKKPDAATEEAARANGLDADQLQEYFDAIQEITDRMEAQNGAARSEIKDVYEKACDATDLPKRVLTHLVALERARIRRERKESKKFEKTDRDAFEMVAEAFGAESPLGAFAKECADRIAAG